MTSRSLPFWIVTLLALAVAVIWFGRPSKPPEEETVRTPRKTLHLSELAPNPNWLAINEFQSTITREDFLRQLDEVFTVSPAWREWFEVGQEDVKIITAENPREVIRLHFAPEGLEATPRRYWRTAAHLPPLSGDLPLEGLKIAIDPGHIGGRWGKMEERWFQIPGSPPVQEGDMTLQVALLLKPQLERLGATVTMVRTDTEPVTTTRPEMLQERASKNAAGGDIVKLAERLFYRTAEIRARARLVNETIKPDIVLCLHFNANPWGDPNAPTLVPTDHFHMILNGGYTDEEIALEDQRHDLLVKLLQGVHAEETAIATSAAEVFVEKTRMPPYLYNPEGKNARNVNGNPYLWARNLLANRLYQCPVAYYEPYVMNSTVDHERIQAGDYEGLREVAGKMRPSIFREYADAVAEGLERYYRAKRFPR